MENRKALQVGYVDGENLKLFESLLLPDVCGMLRQKMPLLTLGLTADRTACGAISGIAADEGVFDVLSFYVAPDYRRQGGGTLLWEALCSALKGYCNLIRIDFAGDDPQTRMLEKFLHAAGAKKSSSRTGIYRTTVGRMMKSPFLRKGMNTAFADPFEELSRDRRSKLSGFAKTRCLPCPPEGFEAASLDQSCSVAVMEKDDVTGYLTVDDSMNGEITISAVYYSEDTGVLRNLLCSFLDQASEKWKSGQLIYIPAAEERFGAMLAEILPDAVNINHSYEWML